MRMRRGKRKEGLTDYFALTGPFLILENLPEQHHGFGNVACFVFCDHALDVARIAINGGSKGGGSSYLKMKSGSRLVDCLFRCIVELCGDEEDLTVVIDVCITGVVRDC